MGDFDVRNHADLYSERIFRVPGVSYVESKISRLLVDPNRFYSHVLQQNVGDDRIISSYTPTGDPVWRDSPSDTVVQSLLDDYYVSFHHLVAEALQNPTHFLIDGHTLWSHGPKALKDAGVPRADIVLGNRDYKTCTNDQTIFIKTFFENKGLIVNINDPYQGKMIMKHYCEDSEVNGIQLEINRQLYLNEETLEPRDDDIQKLHKWIYELVEAMGKSDVF